MKLNLVKLGYLKKSLKFNILISCVQLIVLLILIFLTFKAGLVLKIVISGLFLLGAPSVLFLRYYDCNKVVYQVEEQGDNEDKSKNSKEIS